MTADIKQKKWHQRWWGIIFLVICVFALIYLGLLLYKIVYVVEGQNQISSINLNSSISSPKINIRDFVEKKSSPYYGNKDGTVVIVEFGDFQCPICKAEASVIKRLAQEYNFVKIIFRNFPNPVSHAQALKAALAAQCANEQEKFWEYHDQLFANQNDLSDASLKNIAVNLGLNTENFDSCLDNNKYFSVIESDMKDGLTLDITATPTFYINGNKISGNIPYSSFVSMIDKIKQSQVQ